jgi:riboflavin transporter FmnP
MDGKMNAKTLTFTLIMGALGNVLFAISYHAGNLAPGIALDFSLIAAFIAGFYGGPLIGFVSGLLVGIMPGIMFGPLGMGAWLGLIGLPLGKALTGLTAGVISKGLNLRSRQYSSLLAVPATLAAYIPECIYTYIYFASLMPFFLGGGGAIIFIYYILPKALGEVIIMSFLMAALIGNSGFNNFVGTFFTKVQMAPRITATKE